MNHHPVVRWTATLSCIGLALFALLAVGYALAHERTPAEPQAPMGSAFTYQGQLKDSAGNPVTDICDLRFILYDAEVGGAQVSPIVERSTQIAGGYFTILLDFGNGVFTGEARWLEVAVRCPAGSGEYILLSPRQALTAAPYALDADLLDGQDALDFASAGHTHAGEDITSGMVADAYIDTSLARDDEIFPTVLNHDGAGSTLDADLLDGQHASDFASTSHDHWGQSWSGSGTGLTLSGGTVGLDGSGTTYGIYGGTDSTIGWAGYFSTESGAGVGISAPAGGVALEVQQGQVRVAEGIRYPDGVLQSEGFFRPRLPGPGSASIVDSSGNVGSYSSITIGADGFGLISYFDNASYDLKVLHCGNTACNSANTTTTIDSDGYVGTYTSITIGADGLGLISYYDNGDLAVLHCGNTACNSGNTITTLDSGGDFSSSSTSIAIGADGLGLMSYFDRDNGLKVLHCGNTACNGGNTISIVDNGDFSGFSAITIGADGLGLISYTDYTPLLKVLHCGNPTCDSGNTISIVDSSEWVGMDTSITIGADGLGLISYADYTPALKVLHCGNPACNSGNTITTVDSSGFVGSNSFITIGADGFGLISYPGLRVLHCGNSACDSGNTITAVDNGVANSNPSITIGVDGLGLISYYDQTNHGLKVFKCSNLTCEAYIRVGR